MELLIGFVGAVLGAVATVVAVWLTIRHERNLLIDQAADEAVARMQSAVLAYMFVKPEVDPREARQVYLAAIEAILMVQARLLGRYGALGTHVFHAAEPLFKPKVGPIDPDVEAATHLTVLANYWWSKSKRALRRFEPEKDGVVVQNFAASWFEPESMSQADESE